MDPQLKSILTSVGLGASMALTGWAVKQGYIDAADQSADASYLLAGAGVIVAAIFGWYKTRQVTPTAAIQQVNAQDNGVKVVARTEPAPAVNAPIPVLTSGGK